ncbi:hypothetical protein J6590_071437 [Homalodisca vitripennis]|nr:hypothetical protein J6590_071437 [Homalodisca vitripennis]
MFEIFYKHKYFVIGGRALPDMDTSSLLKTNQREKKWSTASLAVSSPSIPVVLGSWVTAEESGRMSEAQQTHAKRTAMTCRLGSGRGTGERLAGDASAAWIDVAGFAPTPPDSLVDRSSDAGQSWNPERVHTPHSLFVPRALLASGPRLPSSLSELVLELQDLSLVLEVLRNLNGEFRVKMV